MLDTRAYGTRIQTRFSSLENSFCHLSFHSVPSRVISRASPPARPSHLRIIFANYHAKHPTLAISFLSFRSRYILRVLVTKTFERSRDQKISLLTALRTEKRLECLAEFSAFLYEVFLYLAGDRE